MKVQVNNFNSDKYKNVYVDKKSTILTRQITCRNYDMFEISNDLNTKSCESDFLKQNYIRQMSNPGEVLSGIIDEYQKCNKAVEFYENMVQKDEESNCPFTLIRENNKMKLEEAKNNLEEITDSNSERNQKLKGFLQYQEMILRLQKALAEASHKSSDTIESFNPFIEGMQEKINTFQFDKNSFCNFMTSLNDFYVKFVNFKPIF